MTSNNSLKNFSMYWVYIIRNNHGIFYKGFSADLEKRILEHNSDLSRFTSGKGPWVLVYSKKFDTKMEALIEEKRVKRLNVKSIQNLISVGWNTCLTSRLTDETDSRPS